MGKDLKGKELGKGISQRSDGRYTARYTNKHGRRMQTYDLKLSIVKQWLINVKYEDENGILGEMSSISVSKWFTEWIENYKKNIVGDSTIRNYKQIFRNHLEKSIGNMQLKSIKPIHLQQILNNLYDNGYSYGTMEQVKITMHALFKDAITNDLTTKNPAQNVKCKSKIVEDRRVLTISEQQEFLKYSSKSMYYNAYALCLQTGLRAGEIGGIKWEDIDWDRKILKIQRTLLFDIKDNGGFYFGTPKTKSSVREVPLSDEAIEILKNQKIEQFKLRIKCANWETKEDYNNLIFTSVNGKPTGYATYRNNIFRIVTNINKDRRAVAEINKTEFIEFKSMYMHALRHTFATRCIENCMNPKILQSILGHSSISMTMDLYVHVTDEIKHEEIKKINKQFVV